MDINAIRELALQHGIVILDYEDKSTIRQRIAGVLEVKEAEVSDETLAKVTEEFYVTREIVPYLTELDGAAEEVDRALREAMVAAGVLEEELACRECGEPMFIEDNGVSHHGTPDEIDYDADGGHVAVAEEG